jgi:uncharacterized protein YidB (DUF937 family)
MGLLDSLLGSVLGGGQQSGGQQNVRGTQQMLVEAAMGLLNRQGGLSGLLQVFQQAGLGEHAGSWVSTGENIPVSGDQVQQALGQDQIAAIAQKIGIPPELAAAGLAKILPHVVDQATPQGEVPAGSELDQILGLLKGRLLGS